MLPSNVEKRIYIMVTFIFIRCIKMLSEGYGKQKVVYQLTKDYFYI